MSASPKQIKLIEDLQNAGAIIPEHPQFDRPDDSMFLSAHAADAYIKQNLHILKKLRLAASRKRSLDEFSARVSPAEWGGIPNH